MELGRPVSRRHDDARIRHAGSHPVGVFSIFSTRQWCNLFVVHIFTPRSTKEKCVNSLVGTPTRPNAVALRADYMLHRIVAAYDNDPGLLPKICFVILYKTRVAYTSVHRLQFLVIVLH